MSLTPFQLYTRYAGHGSAPTTSYVGPGDIVSGATVWYGLRGYNAAAALATKKAINVQRASDNATMDIGILRSGDLDVATLTTFLTSTTGAIKKWYNQAAIGNDAVQNSATSQPLIPLAVLGSFPTVRADSNLKTLIGSTITPATGVVSLSAVFNRSSGTSAGFYISENATGNRLAPSTANLVKLVGGTSGTISATAADAAWHAANGVINGASSVLNVDGTETTGTCTGNTAAGTVRVDVGATSTNQDLMEVGVWDNIAFSSTNRTDIKGNQRTYWGF